MLNYITYKKMKFLLSVLLMISVSLGTLYSIYMRSQAVNLLLERNPNVFNVIFFMLSIIVVTEILKLILSINNASLLKIWNLKLGKNISTNVMNMGYNYFHQRQLGDYIAWYTGDLPLVNSYIFSNIFVIVNHVTLSVVSFIMLYVISWKIALFSLVLLALLFFFGSRLGKKIGMAYQNMHF